MWKKIVITLGVLIVGVPLVIGGLLIYATRDMCGNEMYAEELSPDKKYKAVIFQRDCGATTGFSTQISIIGANDELENESGTIFIIDGHPDSVSPEIRWLSNAELSIEKILNGSEYKAEKSWGFLSTIKVSYGPGSS